MKKAEFFSRLKRNPHPVVVDLWAPWCGPCRAMEPAFKEISKKYDGKVDVWKINADDSQDVLKALGVRAIPTVIGFAKEKEILRRTGMQSSKALDTLFEAALNERKPAVMPLAPLDRILRVGAGLALATLGWYYGNSWILYAIGAVLLFSAVYDRCPIYKMIAPRVTELFHRTN
jgi:thioredoxin